MGRKHLLLMLLCCLIPIGVALGLQAFGIALSVSLPVVMLILCPLLHIMMMAFMHGRSQTNADSGANGTTAKADCHPSQLRHPRTEMRN